MIREIDLATLSGGARTSLRAFWCDFESLGVDRLHALLRLRVDVFVVEQQCPYPEIDGRDPDALHLLLEEADSGALAACLRLFSPLAPPACDGLCHLGRIVTAPAWRGAGLGAALLELGIAECSRAYPQADIQLAAQAHLRTFYARFGFMPVSDIYDEDGIPHIDMRRKCNEPHPMAREPVSP